MKILFYAFALCALLSGAVSVSAQSLVPTTTTSAAESTAELPSPLTSEDARTLMAEMSDEQVRAILLAQLDAAAAENTAEPPASVVDRLTALWMAFSAPTLRAVANVGAIPDAAATAFGQFAQTHGGSQGVLMLLLLTAAIVAAAYGLEVLSRRVIRLPDAEVVSEQDGLWPSLKYLGRRFFREIFGLIVFYISLRILGNLILTPAQIMFAGPLVGMLIWVPRLTAAVSRFLLAPKVSKLRLVNADDAGAVFLHRHIIGLVIWAGAVMFTLRFFAENGVPPGTTFLGYWMDNVIYIYLLWIIWSARDTLSQMNLGAESETTQFDLQVAKYYPTYAMGATVAIWVLVQCLVGFGELAGVLTGAHYATLFWLLMAPVIDTAIRGLVRHLVPPMMGEGPVAENAYRETKLSYIRIGRVLALGALLFIIAGIWDVSVNQLFVESAGLGDNLFRFLLTVVVGYVVYEATSLWINRRLAAEQTALGMTQEDADAEMGGASGSRLSTVLPLMLVTARGAVIVIFGLLAIGNLGIDITPLLAGAGILGLAIGFGAQKLVSDVVSGVFFLIDDAFRTGEYVDIEGTMGAVEKISIRSMQLRHHRGAVHTIPYGEIAKLTNFSRDWVIMKLKFTVPFDTDPNKIKKIFKRIGAEMLEDPLYKDDFLQPFKSQGVFEIDDVGMVIRGKFMAKPGKQFMIRKEIYNKVKSYFEEAGIDFARREVRVALPEMDEHHEMTEAERTAVAGAAAAAQQEPPTPA